MFAQEYVDATAQILGYPVCVTDRDQIIAVSGMAKKELLGKPLHKELEEAINDREVIMAKKGDKKYIRITGDREDIYEAEIIQTIISEGDAIGAVLVLSKDEKKKLSEIERKAAGIAASFLGKQMEG